MQLLISCDTAFSQHGFKVCQETGIVDGAYVTDYDYRQDRIDQIMECKPTSIYLPVIGTYQQMHDKGMEIFTEYKESVTIVLPMTVYGLEAVRAFNEHGIQTCVDLVFNAAQALFAAKSGATAVSVPVGVIDDQGYAGLEVVRSVSALLAQQRFDTSVIATDIRTPHRSVRSVFNGAETISMNPGVFWKHYQHVLTRDALTYQPDAD